MRTHHQRLFFISLFAAAAFLIGGYATVNLWFATGALPIAILAWWIAKQAAPPWLPSALLVIYVGGAAGGVLLGIHPAMMIAGVGSMLVSWDLAGLLEHRQEASGPLTGSLPDRSHLQLLATSVGIGIFIAEGGLLVHFPIPFSGLIAAGLLVLFSLYRFYRLFTGREPFILE